MERSVRGDGPDSAVRRRVKRVLRPLLPDVVYALIQGVAAALDIKAGRWWEDELSLVPIAVRPGENAVDIGANFGLWSYHLDRSLGGSGVVHAFEPVPFTRRVFRWVSRLLRFGNVRLHSVGVGSTNSSVEFRIPVQASGAINAGLAFAAAKGIGSARATDTDRVEVLDIVRLDDALPRVENVALMKLDIEGGELEALRGAGDLLEREHPTLICEVDAGFMSSFDGSPTQLRELLESYGYQTFRLEVTPTLGLAAVPDGEARGGNWVFIHSRYADRFSELVKRSDLGA